MTGPFDSGASSPTSLVERLMSHLPLRFPPSLGHGPFQDVSGARMHPDLGTRTHSESATWTKLASSSKPMEPYGRVLYTAHGLTAGHYRYHAVLDYRDSSFSTPSESPSRGCTTSVYFGRPPYRG
jgi:hypothetical protein